MKRTLSAALAVVTVAGVFAAVAAEPVQRCEDGVCSVTYGAGFFDRYAPVTALDMVSNLPGFALSNGDQNTRGFGGAAGNILINGERVSAKTEQPSDILARMPAADVEKIVVIRGQVGGLDLQGQSVVANVVRRSGGGSGAWTLGARVDQPDNALRPFGEVTYSGARGPLQFTASLEAENYQRVFEADESVFGADGALVEFRDEIFDETGDLFVAALTASVTAPRTRFGLNLAYEDFDESGGETSVRSAGGGGVATLFQGDADLGEEVELGLDVERRFGEDWSVKGIGLYRRETFRELQSLVRLGTPDGDVTDVETDFDSLETEAIARLEADFSGWSGHLIEASVEGALNRLESDFLFLENVGGALTPREVPGANTEVEEERVDFRVSDATRLGGVSVEAALGGESSTITQTGGFEESRSFFFWKPSLTLSYAPNPSTQLRGRALREVGQLNFFDFTSAADLGDGELALGNPNLSPETTVTIDATYERRFGEIGVVSVTGFHDWIDDVADVLPLAGGLEVPGNIGSGARTGVRGEVTVALDRLGLAGGRLDASGVWRTSRVTDPLTGAERALSGERDWDVDVELRQDVTRFNLAWGVTFFAFDEEPEFGLNEFETDGRRRDADAFIETRAIEGLRVRLGVENVFRGGETRDRSVFEGPRDIAPFAFREVREESFSREISLQVTGVF